MTVEKLIDELRQYPSDMEVVVATFKGYYISPRIRTMFMGTSQKEHLVLSNY